MLLDFVCNRRSDKQRRVGTDNDTQQDSECKATDRATTQDEDTKHHDEGRKRGIERTRERRVQGIVDYPVAVALRIELDGLIRSNTTTVSLIE